MQGYCYFDNVRCGFNHYGYAKRQNSRNDSLRLQRLLLLLLRHMPCFYFVLLTALPRRPPRHTAINGTVQSDAGGRPRRWARCSVAPWKTV